MLYSKAYNLKNFIAVVKQNILTQEFWCMHA